MPFEDGNTVDYTNAGRKKHLVHLVTSGQRLYYTESGSFSVKNGSLILISDGARYKTISKNSSDGKCSGIGICFESDNFFANGEEGIYFECEIPHLERIREGFEKAYLNYDSAPLDVLTVKSAVYSLLVCIGSAINESSQVFSILKPSIEFINDNYILNVPTKKYADMCNLSESYFRKLFTEYTGVSPIVYRNKLRLKEAKKMYIEGKSTQYIAEKLNFCDSGHLLKLYKKYNGSSLKHDLKTL